MATTHAKRRSKERGIPMSRNQIDKYERMIASKDSSCVLLDSTGTTGSIWAVPHAGQYRPVVVSHNTGKIMTVLPRRVLPVNLARVGTQF
jgi:hypothetical protein